jgi:hypothetical protein
MKTPMKITGLKFGRLTVLKYTHINNDGKACFDCLCDCGTIKNISGKNLRSGNTKSCGCLNIERIGSLNLKHGGCSGGKTPEYFIWRSIIERCTNPNNKDYKYYGGRGINICPEWRYDFKRFILEMGRQPSGLTIDRIDNNKWYSKENCRWVSQKTQNNNSRNNTILTFNNKSHTISEWGSLLNINPGTISMRLFRKWSVMDSLTKPVL